MFKEPVLLSFQNTRDVRSGGLQAGNLFLAGTFSPRRSNFQSVKCTLRSRGGLTYLAEHLVAGGSKA